MSRGWFTISSGFLFGIPVTLVGMSAAVYGLKKRKA